MRASCGSSPRARIAAPVLAAYRHRFPGDAAAANLDLWERFEADNPDSFAGMYQFWVQKRM